LIRNVIVTVPAWESQFDRKHVRITTIHNYSAWETQRDLRHDLGLVYSGSVTIGYGLRELAEIARALREQGCSIPIHLTLKNASNEGRCFLDSLIRDEGLPFHVIPAVNPSRISELLGKGCIGLSFLPRSPEKLSSISAKIFEYMAFGLPVVGENYGYTEWYVKEARCGLLADPSRPNTYADAVRRLLNDRKLFEECRENGFSAIENRFNWLHEEGRLIAFYWTVRGERNREEARV
jgi:glycosyltransferase involved in cell wall biosynthesis